MGVFPCGKCGESWLSFDAGASHVCNALKVQHLELQVGELKKDNERLELMYDKAAKERGVADRLNAELIEMFRRNVHPYAPSVAVVGETYPLLFSGADYKRVLEILQQTEKRVIPVQKDTPEEKQKFCDHRWADAEPGVSHSTRMRCRDCGLLRG